jgi:hypothetical protein
MTLKYSTTMARNHNWIGNTCRKCGLLRESKTRKILMATVNHPPWDIYRYEQYHEYYDGHEMTNKRPDCRAKKQ